MTQLVPVAARSFCQIAPQSWEHPADRAALQTLRAVPGFDLVVKKTIGFLGERGIRMMFQANAVRVGPTQFPVLHRLAGEVHQTFDWSEEVELFVSQTPWFNAGAYGVDRPFIVLNSATLDLLDERELRVLIGHEMGHVMSDHALYRTMLAIVLTIGMHRLPFLTGIALLPIRLALQEWSRKSELSADRAALLASQNLDDSISMFLKAAGGTITQKQQLSLAAYKEQIAEYQQRDGVDSVFKILNLLDRTHPFHTLRAAELQRWSQTQGYQDILAGKYRKRGERRTFEGYSSDFNDAATYYVEEALARASEMGEAARNAARDTVSYAARAAGEAKQAVKDAAEKINHAIDRNR
jgi:Zn-dependent protease with chaperone function